MSDAKASDKAESVQTRGLARNMKDKFMQDVEERKRNVKKTHIVIDHAVQDTFENNPDESLADYKASDRMDSIPTRGLAKTMTEKFFQDVETRGKVRKTQIVIDRDGNPEVFENDPEGHYADSFYEEGADSVAISRGTLGNLKEKFFEDVENRRGNITKTAVDIPELHGTQDVFENNPEESSADVKASLSREEH